MKIALVLCSVVALVVSETYEPNNDNFDIEALVKDTDGLKKFNSCFVHQTDCDEVSSDFRKNLKEAYEQACAKCTQSQKHILKKYIEGLKEKLPDQYQEFKNYYDPQGKFTLPLETAIATA